MSTFRKGTSYSSQEIKMHNQTKHQSAQIKVIDQIERQVIENNVRFSTVSQVGDYAADDRITLTSVHFPDESLIKKIHDEIITPLKKIDPGHFYYPMGSMHMSIKNIRVVANPPNFTKSTIEKSQEIFSQIINDHHVFRVYFYRLLFFKNNIAIVGTTDPELDAIMQDLDQALAEAGIPDDKQYANSKHFFSNMTFARFSHPPTQAFKEKAQEIQENMRLSPYIVDSVSLISTNASLTKKTMHKEWALKPTILD